MENKDKRQRNPVDRLKNDLLCGFERTAIEWLQNFVKTVGWKKQNKTKQTIVSFAITDFVFVTHFFRQSLLFTY